ncbi:MAG: hypothetical protein IT557_19940 [Alphaproteobacteria bacterium]|nr:hypothetical protein [Alphaproteobacteria bacterium]
MSMPIPYATLDARFAEVRTWGKDAFPKLNRCTICMGHVLGMMPAKASGDVTLANVPGAEQAMRGVAGNHQTFSGAKPDEFYVRASEMLPRVITKFGKPDIEGATNLVWPAVVSNRGVLYFEDCYQTKTDKAKDLAFHITRSVVTSFFPVPILYQMDDKFATGDHWDLFDGKLVVSLGGKLRQLAGYPGKLMFWKCTS